MELSKKVETIPNGAILYNNKVYIPYNNMEGLIPENSIFFQNKIYTQYIDNNNKEENQNIKEISKHKSEKELLPEKDNLLNKRNSSQKRKSKSESKKNMEKKEESNDEEKSNIKSEEEIFKEFNKYYYNIEEKKLMKYSLNKFNISRKTNRINSISYNCYDTYCMGRANAIISYTKIDNKYSINIKQFIIRNNHSIDYNNHVFIINQKINTDIKNNKIDKNSLKDICYARAYFINVINNNIYTQLNKIEIDFIKKYDIKEINTRNNDSVKIPVKKVIASASIYNK